MTLEEFVAEMKQAPHEGQTPAWLAEQQGKAVDYGFTWEAVCQLIREQATGVAPIQPGPGIRGEAVKADESPN